jgi:hypothetical protein
MNSTIERSLFSTKAFFIAIGLLIAIPLSTRAQSITTGALSTTTFCQQTTITVNYTATGTFDAKNHFDVQISAPDGTFSPSFTIIGSVTSTTSGSITATLPSTAGSHFRLRVASTKPYIIGNDNGSDITVGAAPPLGFYDLFWPKIALLGDSIFISTTDTNAGYSFLWNFGDGANPATSTTPSNWVTFSTPGTKYLSFTVTSPMGCSTNYTDTIGWARIFTCNPSIPHDAYIDSVNLDTTEIEVQNAIWVVPGATLGEDINYGTLSIFAEPGSIIRGDARDRVIYLKDGAVYDGTYANRDIVIYSPGAGLNNTNNAKLLKCPSLSFDYSSAPPYKISWAGVTPISQPEVIVSVYPDPATHLVSMKSEQTPQSISVRNELGEVVLRDAGPIRTSTLSFDVSQFASGNYYIELDFGGGTQVRKFTVRR